MWERRLSPFSTDKDCAVSQSFFYGGFKMSSFKAAPAFGGKHNTQHYYTCINSILAVLRPASSLRVIGNHLNTHGFKTPSGLEWNRDRVATYIRNNK
jgi:hypothetical protein